MWTADVTAIFCKSLYVYPSLWFLQHVGMYCDAYEWFAHVYLSLISNASNTKSDF